jgi:hypothetical protein
VEEGLVQINSGQSFAQVQVKQKVRLWTSDKNGEHHD